MGGYWHIDHPVMIGVGWRVFELLYDGHLFFYLACLDGIHTYPSDAICVLIHLHTYCPLIVYNLFLAYQLCMFHRCKLYEARSLVSCAYLAGNSNRPTR
jgi:hypothetical protein